MPVAAKARHAIAACVVEASRVRRSLRFERPLEPKNASGGLDSMRSEPHKMHALFPADEFAAAPSFATGAHRREAYDESRQQAPVNPLVLCPKASREILNSLNYGMRCILMRTTSRAQAMAGACSRKVGSAGERADGRILDVNPAVASPAPRPRNLRRIPGSAGHAPLSARLRTRSHAYGNRQERRHRGPNPLLHRHPRLPCAHPIVGPQRPACRRRRQRLLEQEGNRLQSSAMAGRGSPIPPIGHR